VSALDATYLAYATLALLLVAAATWSVHRHTAPLLFDVVDADEMAVAGLHRLVTAGHVLVAAAGAAYAAPSTASISRRPVAALLGSLGGLLALLAVLHLGLVALFFRVKARRTAQAFGPVPAPRPAWPTRPVLIPGATPPIAPMPPPVFHAPRTSTAGWAVPPGTGTPAVAWTSPPPVGPRLLPPYPPPWCRPLPATYDAWATPRR
jgi:hypothetical protein